MTGPAVLSGKVRRRKPPPHRHGERGAMPNSFRRAGVGPLADPFSTPIDVTTPISIRLDANQ